MWEITEMTDLLYKKLHWGTDCYWNTLSWYMTWPYLLKHSIWQWRFFSHLMVLLMYGAKWIILIFSYLSPEFIYRHCTTPVWLLSRPGCCAIRCCSRVSPSAQIPEDWEGSHSEAGKLPSKSTACLVLIVLWLLLPSRPLSAWLQGGYEIIPLKEALSR